MRAAIGDRVIVTCPRLGAIGRDGLVVALHHPDGTPPWDVQWSDTGRTTTYFPGPDTRVHHYPSHRDRVAAGTAPAADG